ncbi:MAG: hypothetical protein NTV00_15270 [Methylococcales bacterium]|nr:hypothetical protein [Methylococcales bacterium]
MLIPRLLALCLFYTSSAVADTLFVNEGDFIQSKTISLSAYKQALKNNAAIDIHATPPCYAEIMTVNMRAGKTGSEAGVSDQTKLPSHYDELYVSYQVKFGDNFDFKVYPNETAYSKQTGKLPGLSGGDISTNSGGIADVNNLNRGWSVRFNWRDNGNLKLYVYHLQQKEKGAAVFADEYGDDFDLNVKPTVIDPAKTYNLTLHVKMNVIGQANGVLESFVDGLQVAYYDKMLYRNEQPNSGAIERLFYSVFLGGSASNYQHKQDEQINIAYLALHRTFKPRFHFLNASNCLMALAEQKCVNYFKPDAATNNAEIADYLVRAYVDNYLGTKDNAVYVYGKDFPALLTVGTVDTVSALLQAGTVAGCAAA